MEKTTYEPVKIEFTPLKAADIIKTSGSFHGEEDSMKEWDK